MTACPILPQHCLYGVSKPEKVSVAIQPPDAGQQEVGKPPGSGDTLVRPCFKKSCLSILSLPAAKCRTHLWLHLVRAARSGNSSLSAHELYPTQKKQNYTSHSLSTTAAPGTTTMVPKSRVLMLVFICFPTPSAGVR